MTTGILNIPVQPNFAARLLSPRLIIATHVAARFWANLVDLVGQVRTWTAAVAVTAAAAMVVANWRPRVGLVLMSIVMSTHLVVTVSCWNCSRWRGWR